VEQVYPVQLQVIHYKEYAVKVYSEISIMSLYNPYQDHFMDRQV